MEKIGKWCGFCFVLGLFISGSFINSAAQDALTVEASVSESTIYTGSRLQLDITISGDFNEVSRPDLPAFQGLRLVSSIPSTSRNFSYINGVSTSSYTYSYFLSARQPGTYTIPSIPISVDGEQHQTQPIKVTVIDRNEAVTGADSSEPDIFLRLNVSDQSVVPGQQIIANVVLYFKDALQVSSYQPIPGWKAEGFWKEQLEGPPRPQVEPTVIDGMRYNKARLLQFALFPTKAGELTISPYTVRVLVSSIRSQRDPFSSFFGSLGRDRRRLELDTEPITVEVNALPESSGTNYIGAVGSFEIQREINADSVEVGESIEITTTISGTGNIPLLTKPDYKLPDNLEIYRPQTNVAINRKGGHIRGTKTFTDVVIPRNPGIVTIPKATISYYNASQGDYVEEILPAKTITIRANPKAVTQNGNTGAFAIRPVTGLVNWRSPKQISLINYWWFWAGLLLPVAGLAVGYWRRTYIEKLSNDRNFARSRQAIDIANERLKQAVDYAENGHLREAYNGLQKALTGFISDKLGMPEAGLSIEQYVQALKEHNVNNDLIKNVRMLLDKCATINYAPDSSSEYLKSHVGLARSIIKKLRKEL